MGKDLRGKEIGQGLSQRKDGYYVVRYTDRYGKHIQNCSWKWEKPKNDFQKTSMKNSTQI